MALHEARLLHGRHAPILLVSVGTGQGPPCECAPSGFLPTWLQHLVAATGDVAHTDATVRHLLGPDDRYWRFHPVGDLFGVALDDARPEVMARLTAAAERHMDGRATELAGLAAALLPAEAEG